MKLACVLLTAGSMIASTGMSFAQAPVGAPSSAAPPAPTAAGASPQSGGSAEPDVATLLFSRPQWAKAPSGAVLTYTYAKKVSDPVFGRSFEDHIVATLSPGHDADARAVDTKMFSGANSQATGQFDSDQNPVLLLVLEENVQELARIFGTNARYLKNRIRDAWREHATIEPAQVDVDGKKIAGTRITIQPFVDNPQTDKMRGLDSMVYTVEIANDVPGNLASIDIHAPKDGASKFSETLHFASDKAP